MRHSLLAVATALCLGCEMPTEAGPRPEIQTDAVSYVAAREELPSGVQLFTFRVVVTISNSGTQPLPIQRCGEDELIFSVEREDGRRSAFVTGWGCGASDPLLLAPGATLVDTVEAIGTSGNQLGGELPLVEGRHRISYWGPGGQPLRSSRFDVLLSE